MQDDELQDNLGEKKEGEDELEGTAELSDEDEEEDDDGIVDEDEAI